MKILNYIDFSKVYKESVSDILPFLTSEMQSEIAKHNYGWREVFFDFESYFYHSTIRYYKVYRVLTSLKNPSVCEIGGFWGIWPLTLKKLGFNIAMTETLKYYNKTFDSLFNFIQVQGIPIFDYDPFVPHNDFKKSFDFISILAVIEHYPHSLKCFMENIIAMTRPHGQIYIEVPNIAFFQKRIRFLFGKTPLVPLLEIYKSEVPFIGHHHEMTIHELRELGTVCNLSIINEDYYNYSGKKHPLLYLVYTFFKNTREVLAILYQLKN